MIRVNITAEKRFFTMTLYKTTRLEHEGEINIVRRERWFLMWDLYLVGAFFKEKTCEEWKIKYIPQEVDFTTYGDKSFPEGLYVYVKSKGKTVPDGLLSPNEKKIYDWLGSRKINDELSLWDEAKETKLKSSKDKYWITNNILDLSLDFFV